MRRFSVVLVTFLALAVPAAGRGAVPPEGLIVVGASVGPIELGMTTPAVTGRFGQPRTTERFRFVHGERGRVARYVKRGGAFRVVYARGRVVGIETTARYYRTKEGVGPGATLRKAGRLPGFRPEACTGGFARLTSQTYTGFSARAGNPDGPIGIVLLYKARYIAC